MTDWDDDILSESETDGNIIELTDIVERGTVPETEDVIELTDIVKEADTDLNLDIVRIESDNAEEDFEVEEDLGVERDLGAEEDLETEEDFEIEEETSFNKELELEMEEVPMADLPDDLEENAVLTQEIALSSEQIEAALERVIEKKFANKIETILFEVLEKVIEREIAEIRESLQKDLDQIGNV